MYQLNFAFGLWLSGEKCVECSCDRHGRLLLRQTQQRSGMHRKLSFVEGFALLWTILLRSSWELFHQASLLPILGQVVFKVGRYNRGATEARLQFLSYFIVRHFRASTDHVLQLLNDFLRVSVQVLIEKIHFLLSADRCEPDQSVESCFPDKKFSV